jgi:aminoglycoside phosphotransferase (APT) family kinase protein
VYAAGVPPPAEVPIDIALVRALLEEQHPDLAALPIVEASEGWDNRTFRLGEELAIRLPRRAASAPLIEHEQRWLPILAPHLPLPIPNPLRIGRAGCGFPWSWSVTRWLPGEQRSCQTTSMNTPSRRTSPVFFAHYIVRRHTTPHRIPGVASA